MKFDFFNSIKGTFKSVFVIFGNNLASSILGALGGLLVARYLGPEDIGQFRVLAIPLTYLTFLHLGTFDGLWRQIPFNLGKGNTEKINELVSTAGAWNWSLSLIVSVCYLMVSVYGLINKNYFLASGCLAQSIICWSIFYGGFLSATYRTVDQIRILAKIQLLNSTIGFFLISFIPFLKFHGLCVKNSLPSIFGNWSLYRNRPFKIELKFNNGHFLELIKIGLPFSIWGSLYTSIWIATEGVLVLTYSGITGVGLYSVAVILREGMNIFPQSIYQVLTPRLVENYARDGTMVGLGWKYFKYTSGLILFMAALVLGVSSLVGILVPAVIPRFSGGIPLMKIGLWFAVVQAASFPLTSLFAAGKPWRYGRGVLIGLLAFPLSVKLLLPHLDGALAVLTGSLIGRILMTGSAYVEIWILAREESR